MLWVSSAYAMKYILINFKVNLHICNPGHLSLNDAFNSFQCWLNINYCYKLISSPFTGALAKYSGGQIYHYPSFQSATHGEKLRHELARDLTRETAWEAVMRIRCGKGLSFHVSSTTFYILEQAHTNSTYTFSVLFGFVDG